MRDGKREKERKKGEKHIKTISAYFKPSYEFIEPSGLANGKSQRESNFCHCPTARTHFGLLLIRKNQFISI